MATSRSKTRSIIKDELVNFNSFQDSQLNTLNNISKSLDNTLTSSTQVRDSLSSMLDAMNSMTNVSSTLSKQVSDRLTSITDTMKSMTDKSQELAIERVKFQGQMNRRQLELQDELSKRQLNKIKAEEDTINKVLKDIESAGDNLDAVKFEEYRQSVENSIKLENIKLKSGTALTEVADKLKEKFISLSKTVSETANKYSQLSNELIKVSGANAADVRDTRSEMVQDIISELNKETRNYFNPEASYAKMIEIANSAGIGNLEAIEELTRPMLLASETLNVNNGELATLLNRWYTRYNFSSHDMEDMLDGIRENTAGNNATEADVQEAINSLAPFIAKYADDKEYVTTITDSLTEVIARASDAGVNTSTFMSSTLENWLYGYEPTQFMLEVLNNAGLSYYDKEAIMSGSLSDEQLTNLLNSLLEGYIQTADELTDSMVQGMVASNWGGAPDVKELMAVVGAEKGLQTQEEFEQSTESADSMVELVDGKFNTVSDQLKNILSSVSEFFAKWQEKTGVAWSDIISIGTGIYSVMTMKGIKSLLSGEGGGLGGAGGTSTIGNLGTKFLNSNFMANQYVNTTMAGEAMGLSGTAATAAGTALTVGGVAAGGVLAWDGVKTLVDDGSDATEKIWAGVEAAGGATGIAGLIALGATNPVGWIALAVGGIGFLGKKAYEEANVIDAQTQHVVSDIEAIGKSFEQENNDRLSAISELSLAFKEESDLSEKIRMLRDSGLFSEDSLINKTEEELENLVESYKNTVIAMNSANDRINDIFAEDYEQTSDSEMDDLISRLENVGYDKVIDPETGMEMNDSSTMRAVLATVLPYVKDEDTIAKINKYLALDPEDFTERMYKDVINGGANKWFDDASLKKQGIEYEGKQLLAGLLDQDDMQFTDPQDYTEAATLYGALNNAMKKEEFEEAYKNIKNSDVEDIIKAKFGNDYYQTLKKAKKFYATGSNYITSDQVANIHEGEAIVPKQYNPAANVTELEMLRSYYKDSTTQQDNELAESMREFKETLVEIKEFLSYWREDNIKREATKSRTQRFTNNNTSASYVARYMV